ncbi:MAG: hypothetical protein KIT27_12260 [Legionellales bacterium]|nr:hypothetical protein [Legionellales bacterium]
MPNKLLIFSDIDGTATDTGRFNTELFRYYALLAAQPQYTASEFWFHTDRTHQTIAFNCMQNFSDFMTSNESQAKQAYLNGLITSVVAAAQNELPFQAQGVITPFDYFLAGRKLGQTFAEDLSQFEKDITNQFNFEDNWNTATTLWRNSFKIEDQYWYSHRENAHDVVKNSYPADVSQTEQNLKKRLLALSNKFDKWIPIQQRIEASLAENPNQAIDVYFVDDNEHNINDVNQKFAKWKNANQDKPVTLHVKQIVYKPAFGYEPEENYFLGDDNKKKVLISELNHGLLNDDVFDKERFKSSAQVKFSHKEFHFIKQLIPLNNFKLTTKTDQFHFFRIYARHCLNLTNTNGLTQCDDYARERMRGKTAEASEKIARSNTSPFGAMLRSIGRAFVENPLSSFIKAIVPVIGWAFAYVMSSTAKTVADGRLERVTLRKNSVLPNTKNLQGTYATVQGILPQTSIKNKNNNQQCTDDNTCNNDDTTKTEDNLSDEISTSASNTNLQNGDSQHTNPSLSSHTPRS